MDLLWVMAEAIGTVLAAVVFAAVAMLALLAIAMWGVPSDGPTWPTDPSAGGL